MDILQEAKDIFPYAVEIRRQIHANPELGGEEKETAALICKKLDELGISYTPGIAGYGVVAQIGNGSKAVGIRADIDALPVTEDTGLSYTSCNAGKMHACGHDMHTATLLGTAAVLKKIEDKLNENDCAVKLFFQPAEETIGGAKRMIEAGCMENPKVTNMLALHVAPAVEAGKTEIKYGPMNAQTQGFRIVVNGKACHGAHPDAGTDAIVIASDIVGALQTISSRFNDPTTPVIVTIGTFHAGEAGNIIAGTAEMTGTMRALDPKVMDANKAQMVKIVEGIASAYGGSAEVHFATDGYPALINDDYVTSVVEKTARKLLGDDNVVIMKEASLGGDDFAYFSNAAPGSYFNIGTTKPGDPMYSLHNEHFAPEEDAMITGITVEVGSALTLLGIEF